MSKKTVLAVVIPLVAAAIGTYLLAKKKGSEGNEPKYAELKVKFEKIRKSFDTTGDVRPLTRIEVVPNISGRIEKILCEEGNKVKSGQVLALMSSTDRTAILDAALAMGKEEYEHWKDTYKPIKIISPIDGTIILKNVVEGQTVSGSTKLFAIADKLIVNAYVDESDIGKVKEGQRAEITLDSYPDRRIKGRVFQILDEGKNTNNVITYTVKIMPFSIPSFFKSKMTANIRIFDNRTVRAIAVPLEAVENEDGDSFVTIGFRDKKPVKRKVVVGDIVGDRILIESGLKEGDVIFIKKNDYVLPKKSSKGKFFLSPRSKIKKKSRRAMRKMR